MPRILVADALAEDGLERLRRAGVNVTAKLYPGATHSFLEAVSVADVARRALEDGSRWMKSQLQ